LRQYAESKEKTEFLSSFQLNLGEFLSYPCRNRVKSRMYINACIAAIQVSYFPRNMAAAASPLLSPDDLFTHLRNSLGITLQSIEDLLRPKPETLRPIYAELLAICYARNHQALFGSGSLRALENVSYPDLVEGQVPVPVLFARLRELMRRLNHFDFQLRDLLSPDFKRTRLVLSEIVNFLKFRTDEEIVMGEDGQAVSATAFTEEHDHVQDELARVQQDVLTLRQKQHDLEAVVVPKQHRIQQLTEDKQRAEDQRRDLESDVRRLETELGSTEEQSRRTGVQNQTLEEKLSGLESQVTTSPDRVNSSLLEAQQVYEREESQTMQWQEKVVQCSSRYQSLQKALSRLREGQLVLEPYQLTIAENKRLKGVMSERNAEILALDKELKRLELSVNSYSRESRKYEEQKARTQASNEAKLIMLDKQREERLSERVKEQRVLADLQERLSVLSSSVQMLEEAIAQLEAQQAARLLELVELHERLMQAVERSGTETGSMLEQATHHLSESVCRSS